MSLSPNPTTAERREISSGIVNEPDYERIREAIRYLERHAERQPDLAELAQHLGLSPSHCQRLFKRWAGVSPKRFLQFLTLEHAKRLLRASSSVLETSYEVGLSGPGRLHDLFVAVEAVTPGEYKEFGAGIEVRWGIHPAPFGDCLVAETERGVCHLSFGDGDLTENRRRLERDWSRSTMVRDQEGTLPTARRIFDPEAWKGEEPGDLRLLLKGTNFQLRVWRALLEVPPNRLVSYGDLAESLGRPNAARAVASAVGANPVSYLVPCHRVLRATGALGGYAWGTARKRAMIAWETARAEPEDSARS
ncbi:MAG: methylated-DNA--[protein]-cysteine S-methyltransferase [Thermoanaerobaculia bacterium]|nr:methylated-DNA--[protein]-cysteine S-methyltransferase [Thermoanaerobaculia bacterium]